MDLPSVSRVRSSTLCGVLSVLLILGLAGGSVVSILSFFLQLSPALSVAMVMHCRSQPILPSLNYPVFTFVPPANQEPETSGSQIPEEGFEVSQFHSQDELGRVVFGFHSPDQSRLEARSLDGSVRGSYSYIDPYGHIVKMQYWDDGTGFHIAGNALPGDGHPEYTPEVKAAREQHLKIYKQTLAAAQHLLQQSDDSSYSDNPDHSSSLNLNQYEEVPQVDQEHQDNSLYEDDKESISLENPELFGNHNIYQEDEKKEKHDPEKEEVEGEVDLGEDVLDEDWEKDGYENDQPETEHDKFVEEEEENDRTKEINEPYNRHNIVIRLKHLMGYDQNEENDHQDEKERNNDQSKDANTQNHHIQEEDGKKIEEFSHLKQESDKTDKAGQYFSEDESNEKYSDSNEGVDNYDYNEEIVMKNGSTEDSEEINSESDTSHDPETSENVNNEMKQTIQALTVSSSGKIGDQAAEKSNSNIKVMAPPTKKRGFFYHFQHTIPRPTERIEEAVERGLKSADKIEVPAFHEPQVALYPFFN